MSEDYPTEDTLSRIEQWPWNDPAGVLDFVASQWHWPDFGVSHELSASEADVVHAEAGDRYLRLATGGWSGNEDLIAALQANGMIRSLTWRLTARGGLHIYQYPQPPVSEP